MVFRKIALGFIAVMMLVNIASSAFFWTSTNVNIDVGENGKAKVTEDINIFIQGNESLDTYEKAKRSLDMTMDKWRAQVGINDIRFHTNAKTVSPQNIKIFPSKAGNCDVLRGTCEAKITIEYDTNEPIFNISTNKTARTRFYKINRDVFLFDSAQSGEIAIPVQTSLTIVIPTRGVVTKIFPLPDNVADQASLNKQKEFKWLGSTILSGFEFQFEIVDSMEKEVTEFFAGWVEKIKENWGYFVLAFVAGAALYALYMLGVNTKKQKQGK